MEGGWKSEEGLARAHYFIYGWSLCSQVKVNPVVPMADGDGGKPHCKVCERSLEAREKYEKHLEELRRGRADEHRG